MDDIQKAHALLESLPDGWDWAIHKDGPWYYCVIRNVGLHREPCYTTGEQPRKSRDSLLTCVQAVYDAYVKGEAVAKAANG